MAGPMKIFQIEGIVPNLIDGFPVKSAFPDLELQDKDASAGKNNGIDPTSDSRHIKLQAEKTIYPLKRFLQQGNLIFPGSGLGRRDGENSRTRKLSKNLGITL